MPIITVYRHGVSAGFAGRNPDPAIRKSVTGWSDSSIRRNTRWLYSVDSGQLNHGGFALTLTMLDCPASGEEFGAVRNAFFHRLRRLGIVRLHWVTEWQKRGVPHLHLAVWFEGPDGEKTAALAIQHWLDLTRCYGSEKYGQFFVKIFDSVGWNQYVSKHASRGIQHYQRNPDLIPSGWTKSGRMWGKFGEWPIAESFKLGLSSAAFYQLRRWLNAYLISQAKRNGEIPRARYLRRRYQRDMEQSCCMGFGEWVDQKMIAAMCVQLERQNDEGEMPRYLFEEPET